MSAQGEAIATAVVGDEARLVLTRGAAAPVEVARDVSGHSQAATGGDTLTVAGANPALVGTATGWTLATDDAGTIRTRTN